MSEINRKLTERKAFKNDTYIRANDFLLVDIPKSGNGRHYHLRSMDYADKIDLAEALIETIEAEAIQRDDWSIKDACKKSREHLDEVRAFCHHAVHLEISQ